MEPRNRTKTLQKLVVLLALGSVYPSIVASVTMPPRFLTTRLEPPVLGPQPGDSEVDNTPYLISINEGYELEVKVRSAASITINLNRAIPEDVDIKVSIFAGPGLIVFTGGYNSTNTSDSSIIVPFKPNQFGDRIVGFNTTNAAGHAEIVCSVVKQPTHMKIDASSAYISINISKSAPISVFIAIVGWIYFLAWSASFYFQVILNYQRKSVIGLNFDFLALNLLGFTCYSIYNFALMFSRDVQKEYYHRNTYRRIPVEYNDLFFAIHALLLTVITAIQCFIYEQGNQKVSLPAGLFSGLSVLAALCLYISSIFKAFSILDVVLYLSYVKLAITIIKYTPQAYMNYKRKATTGWSIHNILLDFTGGVFSIAQMFLLAYNYDDWVSIFGNFTKFGLGLFSIAFDILFVVQHYILYRPIGDLDVSTESVPSPVISQSIRSSSYRPQDGEENVQEANS